MLLCKKIRLDVSEQDAATLECMQGKCRGLYNWWVMRLRDGEKWPGLEAAKKTLQASKAYDLELTWVYGKLLQEVYFRLDGAMQAFFRRVQNGEKPGFPRVRPRHCFFTLVYPAMYIKVEGLSVTLPTGGKGKNKHFPNVIARLTEEAPTEYKDVAISRDGQGHYSASFVHEVEEDIHKPDGILAIDLGIKTLATGVNEQGRFYQIGGFKGHRWYNRQLDKIRSKRDKCQKGSRRYKHLSHIYQRVSQRKRNKHQDCLHKASHLIAHKVVERTVVIGDLSQRQMVMKEHNARNSSRHRAVYNDWGLYRFVQMLRYKCVLYGKDLEILDERDTSKMCSGCKQKQDMPLWKRTYRCTNTECRLVMDRDNNSAVNILKRFLARRGPHTSHVECGVLHADQNSVEVTKASCPTQVQQLKLW
jgi:putative transposase